MTLYLLGGFQKMWPYVSKGGEVQKGEILRDVIYEWPPTNMFIKIKIRSKIYNIIQYFTDLLNLSFIFNIEFGFESIYMVHLVNQSTM